MQMKDKLVKFNHKRPYYTMKKCAITFGVFAALAVSAAIPLSVSYLQKAPVAPHAEEKNEPVVSEDVNEETLENEESEVEVLAENLLVY